MKNRNKRKKSPFKKTYKLSRTIHIYLSSALFALMLFFSFTGFTLNHAGWFTSDNKSHVYTSSLSDDFIVNAEDPSIDQLQAYLKQHHNLSHARSVDIDPDEQSVSFDFPLPDGYAFAIFFLADHQLEVEFRNGSGIALLNDLHKGRHTGAVWSWVIDLCAWLFCVFSITGFILIFQNKKHRKNSIWSSVLGTLTPVILFLLFVPSFHS